MGTFWPGFPSPVGFLLSGLCTHQSTTELPPQLWGLPHSWPLPRTLLAFQRPTGTLPRVNPTVATKVSPYPPGLGNHTMLLTPQAAPGTTSQARPTCKHPLNAMPAQQSRWLALSVFLGSQWDMPKVKHLLMYFAAFDLLPLLPPLAMVSHRKCDL